MILEKDSENDELYRGFFSINLPHALRYLKTDEIRHKTKCFLEHLKQFFMRPKTDNLLF